MRRSISIPAVYLAFVGSLFLVSAITGSFAAVNALLVFLAFPWNIVMFYLVGVFGAELSVLMAEQQAAVLGLASALVQAAFLSWLGTRSDRKRGIPEHGRFWFGGALALAVSPALLYVGASAVAQFGENRRVAAESKRLRMPQQEREHNAREGLGVLLRAEYAWADAHPGKGYTTSLSDLAAGRDTSVSAALERMKASRYRVTLGRRAGWWFGPVTNFRFDVGPEEKAPAAHGYYADDAGFIHFARMRESPSAASPLSAYPLQTTSLVGVTPDGSVVAIAVGVRVRFLDAATGGVRSSVITPGDFLQVRLDSLGKLVWGRDVRDLGGNGIPVDGAPDSARTYAQPAAAGQLARTMQSSVINASAAGWFAEYGFVVDSSRGVPIGEPHPAFVLWDAETGARRLFVRTATPQAPVMFSPDRRFVVTRVYGGMPHPSIHWTRPSPNGSADDIGSVNVWDIATGRMLYSLPANSNPSAIGAGGLILNVRGTAVEVTELATGTVVRALVAPDSAGGKSPGVRPARYGISGTFSRDDRYVATHGPPNIVRLWEVGSGRLIREWDVSKLP